MYKSTLSIVVGTRAELLSAATAIEALRSMPDDALPFLPRLAVAGQERTELDQAIDCLDIEPDADLNVKAPHVADATLSIHLMTALEELFRHQKAAAIMAVGSSATAWAAAVTAYYKEIPIVHLQAGVHTDSRLRPFPEYLHRHDLARLAQLHLCPDEIAAEWLRRLHPSGKAEIHTVGEGADEILARSLQTAARLPEDPTLKDLPSDAPRVLIFMRRREHHANALRPMCDALGDLARAHPDHQFVVVHSLQSHICDALVALLPECPNLRDISPLPHAPFIREAARARLIITDSVGLAREATLLERPLIMVGEYSGSESLAALAKSPPLAAPMDREAIARLGQGVLESPWDSAPCNAFSAPPAGRAAAGRLIDWWENRRIGKA